MAKLTDIFKGFMKNGMYIVDECPYCQEKYSFRFMANFTLYTCVACNETGNYEDFVRHMSDDLIYGQLIDTLSRPEQPEGLLDVSMFVPNKLSTMTIGTGFNKLDRLIGGLRGGEMTILTGKRSEGKSTIAGQLALNAVNEGHKVFFYSGELSAEAFQNWIFLQAAGREYLNTYLDSFGETRYEIEHEYAEPHIRHWLTGNIILYDNRITKTSEANTILDRALESIKHFGCDLIIVDNLKTARFKKDSDRDHFRKQANFAADMLAFANEHNVHVILVAHPKKENTGDANDNVAGLSDITDIAHNVITIKRLSEDEKLREGYDSILDVSKSRKYGRVGKMKMDFEVESKRFTMIDSVNTEHYFWEEEV